MPELTDAELDALMDAIGLHVPKIRELAPCGTLAAYTRHRRHGEAPCAPCKVANTEAKRGRGPGQPMPERRQPISHATPRGYRQHLYRGEAACDNCKGAEAHRQRMRHLAPEDRWEYQPSKQD